MVSGTIDSGNAERVREHDCDGFIAKPFVQSELLEAVGRSLGLRWTTQPESEHEALPGQQADALAPPAEMLRELLALSAGGYPKALSARLAEMAQESAATAAWVAQLTPLLEADADALNAVLVEALRGDARG
jgi:CheY-like chemotaxis protein